MPIGVTCECGEEYNCPDSAAGKPFNCRECDKRLRVPGRRRRKGPRDRVPPKKSAPERPKKKKRKPSPTNGGPQSLEERVAARSEESVDLAGEGWAALIRGIIICVFAVVAYWGFAQLELEGGSARMPIVLLMIYQLGGKYLVGLIIGGIGLFNIVLGCVRFSEARHYDD